MLVVGLNNCKKNNISPGFLIASFVISLIPGLNGIGFIMLIIAFAMSFSGAAVKK